MPGSLATPTQLVAAYGRINALIPDNARYIGTPIDGAVDPLFDVDSRTGLPVFRTRERAVDPRRLGSLVVGAVLAHPLIEVRTDHRVSGLPHDDEIGPEWVTQGRRRSTRTVGPCLRSDRLLPSITWTVRTTRNALTPRVASSVRSGEPIVFPQFSPSCRTRLSLTPSSGCGAKTCRTFRTPIASQPRRLPEWRARAHGDGRIRSELCRPGASDDRAASSCGTPPPHCARRIRTSC